MINLPTEESAEQSLLKSKEREGILTSLNYINYKHLDAAWATIINFYSEEGEDIQKLVKKDVFLRGHLIVVFFDNLIEIDRFNEIIKPTILGFLKIHLNQHMIDFSCKIHFAYKSTT